MLRTTQARKLRMTCCQPLLVVAPDVITMANGQEHVVKAIIGARDIDMALVAPAWDEFVIRGRARLGQQRLVPARRQGLAHWPGRWRFEQCAWCSTHILEVAFTDQGRAVSGVAQQVHKRITAWMQGEAVVSYAVVAGQATGHKRGAVRHAHRIGHVKTLKTDPTSGNAV